ncbi:MULTISPECIES: DUF4272 domain-containing protein [unclassified Pedobacter]|uniref:DUF4272 domain-containing protein n=1 Tax=unclassified Pedobacter TaxID=2628915 RepID=UPI001DC36332|nr:MULTISPECIES: DUF4272 domain-containing protein [unclassified Pedobacter]CAH0157492.1 hypothetical protein SRABI36_00952 [Pedobacter sp. Bi36]CAH0213939.1 hypothetical protein SRABI126_02044 [Pedobacter sp. Bi126]
MKRSITVTAICLFLTLFGCGGDRPNNKPLTIEAVKAMSVPVENIQATKEQIERRKRSEAVCRFHAVPIYTNPNAMFLDPADQVAVRTSDEIVDRAIALCYLELKSEKADKKMLAEVEKKYKVMEKLTAAEKEFALNENPSSQQLTDANWRAEGYHVMLWALGYIDTLVYPDKRCDVGSDVKHLFSRSKKEFREQAKLRSKAEILDQADLILRLDWACVNSRVNNEPVPGNLDKSVVYERHYALNWIIRLMDQDWDGVTTDT